MCVATTGTERGSEMKKFIRKAKDAVAVVAVASVVGGIAALMLSPLGATAATLGWVVGSLYGLGKAAEAVEL
jgi:hypothetical protein